MPVPESQSEWISSVFTGIAEIIRHANSTTKLIGIILISSICFLIVVAIHETEGVTRLFAVAAVVVITLSCLITMAGLFHSENALECF